MNGYKEITDYNNAKEDIAKKGQEVSDALKWLCRRDGIGYTFTPDRLERTFTGMTAFLRAVIDYSDKTNYPHLRARIERMFKEVLAQPETVVQSEREKDPEQVGFIAGVRTGWAKTYDE